MVNDFFGVTLFGEEGDADINPTGSNTAIKTRFNGTPFQPCTNDK